MTNLFTCLFVVMVSGTAVVHAGFGGNLNAIFKAAKRIITPTGHGRGRARIPIATTGRSTSIPLVLPARFDIPVTAQPIVAAESQTFAFEEISPSESHRSSAFNPADLLGQLAITFDKKDSQNTEASGYPSSGNVVSQFLQILPMLMSIAKPVLSNYKGTDGYDGLMGMLGDAKLIFSNREVIREINQLLDDLVGGDNNQTPATPSDSSLNSLAEIAQNMEALFNVPQYRPKSGGKSAREKQLTTNVVPDTYDQEVFVEQQQRDES